MSDDARKLKLDHVLTEALTKSLSHQDYKVKKNKKHKKHKKSKSKKKKKSYETSSSDDCSKHKRSKRDKKSQKRSRNSSRDATDSSREKIKSFADRSRSHQKRRNSRESSGSSDRKTSKKQSCTSPKRKVSSDGCSDQKKREYSKLHSRRQSASSDSSACSTQSKNKYSKSSQPNEDNQNESKGNESKLKNFTEFKHCKINASSYSNDAEKILDGEMKNHIINEEINNDELNGNLNDEKNDTLGLKVNSSKVEQPSQSLKEDPPTSSSNYTIDKKDSKSRRKAIKSISISDIYGPFLPGEGPHCKDLEVDEVDSNEDLTNIDNNGLKNNNEGSLIHSVTMNSYCEKSYEGITGALEKDVISTSQDMHNMEDICESNCDSNNSKHSSELVEGHNKASLSKLNKSISHKSYRKRNYSSGEENEDFRSRSRSRRNEDTISRSYNRKRKRSSSCSKGKRRLRGHSRSEKRSRSSSRDERKSRSHSGDKRKSRSHSREKRRSKSHSREKRRSRSRSRKKRKSRSHSREKKKSRSCSRDERKSRSCSRDEKKLRSPSRDKRKSRSRSRDKKKSRSRSRDKKRTGNFSRDRKRERKQRSRSYSRNERSRSRDRNRRKSRSHSRSERRSEHDKEHHRKSGRYAEERSRRSHSKDHSSGINKQKLLEVAKKNALSMMKSGSFPEHVQVALLKESASTEENTTGKSVQELTDFCRNLSKIESNVASGSITGELDEPFIIHPFKVKEASSIKLNIKNSVQLPVKTHAEKVTENARTLTQQFPVSSGNHHRKKLLEWVPVDKMDDKKSNSPIVIADIVPIAQPVPEPANPTVFETPISYPPLPPPLPAEIPPMVAPLPPPPTPPFLTFPNYAPNPICEEPPMPIFAIQESVPVPVFQPTPVLSQKDLKKLDVQSIVVRHYQAREKLTREPNNPDAANELNEAMMLMQAWVKSQQPLGQYTGTSDVKFLTAEELSGPRPAWMKKHVLLNAAPVTGGKGMSLMKKMGWNPGEGLGKNKEGTLEPLILDIKTDKKGLTDSGEKSTKKLPSNSCNKHPVSALMELSSKKKWLPPQYTIVEESGPPHKRLYRFKVEINNKCYQPATCRQNKKLAKAEAAALCLQDFGVDPSTYSTE